MDVVLFSTNCPKCKVLKQKLEKKGIVFTEELDVNTMLELGIKQAPMLRVDDVLMDFQQSVKWVNAQEGQQ